MGVAIRAWFGLSLRVDADTGCQSYGSVGLADKNVKRNVMKLARKNLHP